jgi:hypothetical protein
MASKPVDLDALRGKVKTQGEKIRMLKKDGAAPDVIGPEVTLLNVLKAELTAATAAQAEVRWRAACPRWRDTRCRCVYIA